MPVTEFETYLHHIRNLTPFVWIQTEEPWRWIERIRDHFSSRVRLHGRIYQPYAKKGVQDLYAEPKGLASKPDPTAVSLLEFLQGVRERVPATDPLMCWIPNVSPSLEAENLLRDIRDHNTPKWAVSIAFLNANPVPESIKTLFQVIIDRGPTPKELEDHLKRCVTTLGLNSSVEHLVPIAQGLSLHQAQIWFIQTIVTARGLKINISEIPDEIFRVVRLRFNGVYGPADGV